MSSFPVFPGNFLPGVVASVEIIQSENPVVARQSGKGKLLSLEVAERILAEGRESFQGELGYDKTWFVLTFAPGGTYTGRYDLQRHSHSLAEHVFSYLMHIAHFAIELESRLACGRDAARETLARAFGV